MQKKATIIIVVTTFLIICILTGISISNQEDTQPTNATTVSNKKIGWGIKRNDNHEQPDVGNENKKILFK